MNTEEIGKKSAKQNIYSFGCGTARFPKKKTNLLPKARESQSFNPKSTFGKDNECKWADGVKWKFTSGYGGGFKGDLILYTDDVDLGELTTNHKKFPFGSQSGRFSDQKFETENCPAYYNDIGFVKKSFNKKYV